MINGQTLRQLRILKGLKQREAAAKLGISRSTYARLEQSAWLHGPELQRILTALGCSVADVEKALSILN